MAISAKASVIGVKEETTTGTLEVLTAGSQFIPMRPGATVTATFETIENDELLNDLGASEPTQGKETPTATHPAYLKHSGVEGQEPETGIMYESCMGGKTVNATQYSTSGTSLAGTSTARGYLKMGSNEEDNFEKGQGLLIKDATNGYMIRNVYDIDSANNEIDLSFNTAVAVPTGTALGKAILYKPASSGHPSFSYWKYEGNGGAVSALAGGQTSSIAFTYTAGQQAEVEFSIDGTSTYWNPIVITASNKFINFTDDVGTVTATLTEKAYKTPHDLADEIASKMTAASVGSGNDTITCTYSSSTGKFTITTNGTTLSLLWKTGTNGSDNTDTHVGTTIGFSDAADDTSATTYTSDNEMSWATTLTPSYDSVSNIVAKNVQLQIGTFSDYVCREASAFSITVDRPNADVDSFCAESGVAEKVPESRSTTGSATLTLKKHEVDFFDRLKNNESVVIAMNVGPKDGSGNWIAGKCVNLYIPQAKITAHNVAGDTFLTVTLEFTGFVTTSQKDFYINFL